MTDRTTHRLDAGIQPAALRSALRPVLRAVIARPGSLYQPLYVGPIPSVDVIEADIQGLAETQGVPAYFGYGDPVRRAMQAGTPAVIVCGVEDASALFADHPTLPERQQIVIWGDAAAEDLPSAIADHLARGFGFDPRPHARMGGGEWTMGPTLARIARDPGNVYNPVLLVAPRSALAFVADEAALRLEAAGLRPVLTFSDGVRENEPALQRLGGGAVVIRMADAPAAAAHAGLAALLGRGVQVVIALTPEVQNVLQAGAAGVLDRAISLIVAGGAERDQKARQTEVALAARSWPPISEVLVSPPAVGRDRERKMGGSLDTFPLPDILQTLGAGRHTGRLAVFTHAQLGTLDVDRGKVVSAWIMGDLWDAADFLARRPDDARALVEQRACAIGQWKQAGFTFFDPTGAPSLDPLRAAVPIDALTMEIARRADEGGRRALRVGGMGRVWMRLPGDPAGLDEAALRLLGAFDGERSLFQLALDLGLLSDEALDAVLQLQGRKLAKPVGELPAPSEKEVHEVAAVLLEWGLEAEALRVLTEAEQAQRMSPEAYALHAHLLAASDPQGAAAAFRTAARGLASTALFDAALNGYLLEVRGRQRPAAEAWREVKRMLREGHRDHARSVRHYAVVAELALRANDTQTADATLAALAAAGAEGRRVHDYFKTG